MIFNSTSLNTMIDWTSFPSYIFLDTKIRKSFFPILALKYCDGPHYITYLTDSLKFFCWLKIFFVSLFKENI